MDDIKVSAEDRQKVIDALVAGRKIEAIKHYREVTGVGLKEAKDFIDKLTLEISEEFPEVMEQNKSGCMGVFLLLIVFGAILFFG